MKLPLDQRTAFADRVLTLLWPVDYWSRDEQLFACAEGWTLSVFFRDHTTLDRITRFHPQAGDGFYTDFATDDEAISYVLQRAQEGSPLHCRAITLHAASVLKYGK